MNLPVVLLDRQLTDVMSGGRHVVLEARDQDPESQEDHYADPEALAEVVAGFFADRDGGPGRAGR